MFILFVLCPFYQVVNLPSLPVNRKAVWRIVDNPLQIFDRITLFRLVAFFKPACHIIQISSYSILSLLPSSGKGRIRCGGERIHNLRCPIPRKEGNHPELAQYFGLCSVLRTETNNTCQCIASTLHHRCRMSVLLFRFQGNPCTLTLAVHNDSLVRIISSPDCSFRSYRANNTFP